MFGWSRIFTLAAVAAAVAVVTGGAGATSTSTRAPATVSHAATAGKISTAASRSGALLKTASVSTRAGAARYLRAIGVDPRGLVFQRGARNYAGPNCPGAGWACTSTAHPVVQIARAGGKNTFFCTSGQCVVVQLTARGVARSGRSLTASAPTNPNNAACIKTTGLGQSCSISQSSATKNNIAAVYESTGPNGKTTGVTQTASFTASITQQATGFTSTSPTNVPNTNTACVYQVILIDGSTNASGKKGLGANVALEAHQKVTINQDATTGGANNANQSASPTGGCNDPDTTGLTQSQTLTSTASASGPIVQNENAANGGPNVSLDIEQNQVSGKNVATGPGNATFTQTNSLTAIAGTTSGSISQTQSSQAGSNPAGGILATVNQYSTGVLTANANQTETQCEDAVNTAVPSGFTCDNAPSTDVPPTSVTQTQYGPIGTAGPGPKGQRRLEKTGKDVSLQTGNNSADTFTIVQHSTQQNDTPGTTQPNITQADCATSGNCTAKQTVKDGNTTTQNTTTGPTVDTTVNCTSTCTTTTTNGSQGLIVGNNAAFGNGPIQTYDLATGALVNSFVPDGATASANGRGVAVVGNEIFYTELSNSPSFGPSDGIHVAPFNNGAGGSDLRVLPNPAPTSGIQDLTYAGGALYALTGYGTSGPLQVWKLDATTGAVIGGPITIGSDPDADGFAILPNGNFLINAGDASCSYTEYNSATGAATGNSFTVPNASTCTGVETDGSSLVLRNRLQQLHKD